MKWANLLSVFRLSSIDYLWNPLWRRSIASYIAHTTCAFFPRNAQFLYMPSDEHRCWQKSDGGGEGCCTWQVDKQKLKSCHIIHEFLCCLFKQNNLSRLWIWYCGWISSFIFPNEYTYTNYKCTQNCKGTIKLMLYLWSLNMIIAF